MRHIVISVGHTGYSVHEDGKYCDVLTWGEMLEQVALLTIPPARVGNGYPMRTHEEWREITARRFKSTTVQEAPPLRVSEVLDVPDHCPF
jgi:hypothetical protein